MQLFGETLSLSSGIFLLLALALALSFEFVNGFHDTANAVAIVIYTNTLKPGYAVVWSGSWNLGIWYFGLPASSSHSLIGSIMEVGLANSLLAGGHEGK